MAKKQNTIGLDIGSNSIKLVQLRTTKQGYALENFAISKLEPEAIYEGGIRDQGLVIERIKELVTSHDLKTKNVALSIGGHSVIVKKITLPAMSDEELAESIRWEAEQYIPYDPEDVYLDHQVLKLRAEQGQMDVLLVAAKRDVVDQYVDVVREVGLKPVVVDTDCFAVQNSFELSYGLPEDELVCLIHVGAESLNLNVISYGVTSFTRDLQLGGEAYTSEIIKQMGCSYQEAEAYKLGGIGNQILPQEVPRILQSISENFASEINRSLEFHLATSGEASFHKIYLSGGGARLSSLSDEIARKSNTPVELIDPFRAIEVNPALFKMEYIRDWSAHSTVALGLSLRHRGDK
jgi:type IV pilus assembly protein PilM